MARMPVEIVLIGRTYQDVASEAMLLANDLQGEFDYVRLRPEEERQFAMLAYDKIHAPTLMDSMAVLRATLRGYHPFMIALVDAPVDGDNYTNLFGSSRSESGLGVLTSAQVPDVIVPSSRLLAYYLYYFARYSHCFIAPQHKNHDDSRGCIYDRKVAKLDLLKSMRAGAFCDECRRQLVSGDRALSAAQFEALEALFAECGRIVGEDGPASRTRRTRLFIGSSSEGLPVARKLQVSLSDDFSVEIWNQGATFGLGTLTLEALEKAVTQYDFGVFVFTPDDELTMRGEIKSVARDNVLFELGLFIGRLGRTRAFVVSPKERSVSLPSDLAGVSTAPYDASEPNLAAAVEPACEMIRDAVGLANQAMQTNGASHRR